MRAGQRVASRMVSDGRSVRHTLEQVAQLDGTRARVDWLRFTLPVQAVAKDVDLLEVAAEFGGRTDSETRERALAVRLACVPIHGAMWLAREAARLLVEALGVLEVGTVEDRGQDFYTARCPVLREGKVVGYCLAGGDSFAQSGTVHVNLHGEACLGLSHANWAGVRRLIDEGGGWITRVDLAVDVFEGDSILDVRDAYLSGGFDVRGKRPKQSEAGSWTSGHSRTFYVGKRETGKLFRGYEKGDQLDGEPDGPNSGWVRYEVELRNNARVIEIAVLDRPADFFAGAYPFCEALMDRLAQECVAERIPTVAKLVDKVATAAAFRVCKWVKQTAAPSVAALLRFGSEAIDGALLGEPGRMPARLRGFSHAQLAHAFGQVADGLAPSPCH